VRQNFLLKWPVKKITGFYSFRLLVRDVLACRAYLKKGGETMETRKINKVLIGEALIGEGNEVAHVDLIIGPRGSGAETAFCIALSNQKRGDNALLAVLAPNMMAKPPTVMFNKVDIKNAKQAVQMFGPAQAGVAEAIADSVKEGVIPVEEANDLFVCVGVFIHWDAEDDAKIQDWNYEATKLAVRRAVEGLPLPSDVIAQEAVVHHPFAAHDYSSVGLQARSNLPLH
jgi:5,6,7,8-tetrahydromethanopterin hydro-lyase